MSSMWMILSSPFFFGLQSHQFGSLSTPNYFPLNVLHASWFYCLKHQSFPPCTCTGLAKKFIQVFSKSLWKNLNEFFDQGIIWTHTHTPTHPPHTYTFCMAKSFSAFIVCMLSHSVTSDYDPVDCSPPGSSVHGILQARILEWVAIFSSRGSSRPRDRIEAISFSSTLADRLFTTSTTWEAFTPVSKCELLSENFPDHCAVSA